MIQSQCTKTGITQPMHVTMLKLVCSIGKENNGTTLQRSRLSKLCENQINIQHNALLPPESSRENVWKQPKNDWAWLRGNSIDCSICWHIYIFMCAAKGKKPNWRCQWCNPSYGDVTIVKTIIYFRTRTPVHRKSQNQPHWFGCHVKISHRFWIT